MKYDEHELTSKLVELAKGSGGVVAMSENDWEVLNTAYGGNQLIQRIAEHSLCIRSAKYVDTGEMIFEVAEATSSGRALASFQATKRNKGA